MRPPGGARSNDRMAVVMDEETVHAFADDTEVTEGRTLLADGPVIEAESEPRGVSGLVRDGSGVTCGVWVQVVGRELTAECDGPCALASSGALTNIDPALHPYDPGGLSRTAAPARSRPPGSARPAPARSGPLRTLSPHGRRTTVQ